MTERVYTVLPARGVIEVAGEDRVAFLQGLVSNDVEKASATRTIYAALLTAQGRYLFDFFIIARNNIGGGDVLYLDGEAPRLADLMKRLAIYKLRAKVSLSDASSRFAVAAAWGDGTGAALGLSDVGAAKDFAGGIAYLDPRLDALGARFLLSRDGVSAAIESAGFARADDAAYDRHRLALGVPDGTRDLPPEKALPMESGFDELNAIDWQKGCYMGQELTARMKYRALVKKRLLPVAIDGAVPAPGTTVMLDGSEAGEIHSGRDDRALALLRLDAVEAAANGAVLFAQGARVRPQNPAWTKL